MGTCTIDNCCGCFHVHSSQVHGLDDDQEKTDVFFAITRYSSNTTLAHTRSIYNDGWVTVGQIFGRHLVHRFAYVRAEIDCTGDLDKSCAADGYNNSLRGDFDNVGDIKVYNLVSKDGSFTSQLQVTRQGDSVDDEVFHVNLYTVAPR